MGLVTFALSVWVEQRPGRGEDAMARSTEGDWAAFIACMDGCGGSGGRHYPDFGGWSGAKVSACLVGNALADWFAEHRIGEQGTGGLAPQKLAEEIRSLLQTRMQQAKDLIPEQGSAVVSRMSKTLPSTLAAVLAEAKGKNTCRICSFWAGDSRTYFFPVTGLQQTSRDDIRSREDPFDSLINDGILSNVVNADIPFQIRWASTTVQEPCMVLAATDGCFSYFPSPMSLEEVLLKTLMASSTPVAWEQALTAELGAVAGDDYTLQLAVIGFSNFAAVKTAYAPRWQTFSREYAEPLHRLLKDHDQQGHRALWLSYKQTYLPEGTP